MNLYSIDTNTVAGAGSSANKPAVSQVQNDFSSTLKDALNSVNDSQQSADKMVANLSNDSTSADLHNVMIAMQKADVLLRTTVQVRDRAVEAYQEVMRMQV